MAEIDAKELAAMRDRIREAFERTMPPAELYGRGPMMDALPALRAWGALSPEERAAAISQAIKDGWVPEGLDG